MQHPSVDDLVRLRKDVPELLLHRGEMGIVRSTWFSPALTLEVEFHPAGEDAMRTLLAEDQVERDENQGMQPGWRGMI